MSWSASDFEHTAVLKANSLTIYWNYLDNDKIEFGVECINSGWCAIGISTSGNMINSDMMVMWMDSDGTANLQNRNTITNPTYTVPEINTNQEHLSLISGSEDNGTQKYRFTRNKYPCNTAQNLYLSTGTTRLIWALHDTNKELTYHGSSNRGSKSINFETGNGFNVELPNDHLTADLTMTNYELPSDEDTLYYCKLIKLPETSNTQHIVRFEPIYTAGNEAHLHHMLLYKCPHEDINNIDSYLNSQQDCGQTENMPIGSCRGGEVVSMWAVGQENFQFPEHVGLEMSGSSDLQYVLLEIHYDIPYGSSPVIDNSGMKIYYTPTLRENNAAILWVGLEVGAEAQFIPPGITETSNYAYCPSECLTSSTISSSGIKVFATALHEHTAGRGAVLRHIRDGQELEPIDKNEDYDFNLQEFIPKYDETVILPGDDLILQCDYTTADKSEFVIGGESTTEEMCMAFMYVYPKPTLARCMSRHTQSSIEQFWNNANSNGYTNSDYDTVETNYFSDAVSWENNDATLEYYRQYWTSTDTIESICLDQVSSDLPGSQENDISALLPGSYVEFDEAITCAGDDSSTPLNAATAIIISLLWMIGML